MMKNLQEVPRTAQCDSFGLFSKEESYHCTSLAPRLTTGSGHNCLSAEKKLKIIWIASLTSVVCLLIW